MPDYGEKPRAVRIPDGLWDAALRTARRRNETVSEVIRRALTSYVRRNAD